MGVYQQYFHYKSGTDPLNFIFIALFEKGFTSKALTLPNKTTLLQNSFNYNSKLFRFLLTSTASANFPELSCCLCNICSFCCPKNYASNQINILIKPFQIRHQTQQLKPDQSVGGDGKFLKSL